MDQQILLFILVTTTLGTLHGNEEAICKDLMTFKGTCAFLAKHKACKTHPLKMKTLCKKTCQFCSNKTSCDEVSCPYKQICALSNDNTPHCRCAVRCIHDKRTGFLCGRNGRTYASLCDLRKDECLRSKDILVKHYGKCIKNEPCVDASTAECEQFKTNGLCDKQKELMQFYCAKTCRLCRQPAPLPACFKSEFGCCWHSNQPAIGRHQKGCKVCRDRRFCKLFIPICGKDINRGAMRQHCPISCGYCPASAAAKEITTEK
eukprot:gene13999-15457_t